MNFVPHMKKIVSILGEDRQYTPVSGVPRIVRAEFMDPPIDYLNISGSRPVVICTIADVPTPVQGDAWLINGLSYTLPLGVTLPAHGRLLLINDAPNAFRTRWNVPAAVAIFQYPGSLQWNAPGRMVRVL